MTQALVLLITGHPATGKTTLAHHLASELRLPLISKDAIKESLVESLGGGTDEWLRKLSTAAWALVYQQIENLLKVSRSHIVESNFDPYYANTHWQNLAGRYDFKLVQLCCETEPSILLKRYIARIESGERHTGHVDASQDPAFLASIRKPFGYVAVNGDQLSINTTNYATISLPEIVHTLKNLGF